MLSTEGFVGARALGEESLQMWDLNKRLEAYLARVKFLEEENEGLRAEIQSTKESPAGDPRRARYEEELRSLWDALHRAFTEKCAAELARDNLYEEVQHVRSRCQKEQAAREEAKRQLSSSKKELEEERRAQIWLKERAVQLEKEVEALLEVHEEEKAGLDQELTSFSQSLEGFRCAPVAFQPVEVEDYSKRLSEIWRGAVETYKAEVSQLERALGQAKENLWQVAEDNQQSQLQLRHLEKELVGLKARKVMLEENLGQQWQEQHGEAEKFQLAIEALEQEKQSLQVQIAQVLEDRQQLMHLKMSLSLEVATYRTLLEAESTRLQMPPGEFKLANSLRDVKLEASSSKHRASLAAFPRPEGVIQLCRAPSDALKVLTPKSKSSSAQEFQKFSSVLQAPRSWELAAPSRAVPVLSPEPGSGGAESPAQERGAGEETPMQSPLSPEQLVSHALQDALKEMQDDAEAKEVPALGATQSTRDGNLEAPVEEEEEEEDAGTQEVGAEGGTVSPPELCLCSNVPTLLSATQSDAESQEEMWEEERSKEEEMLTLLSPMESQEPGGEPWGGDTRGSRLEVGKEDMEATSMEALHVSETKERREPWSPSREDVECEFPDHEGEMREEGSLQMEIEAACAVPVGSHLVLPTGCHLQEDFVERDQESEHQETSLCELDAGEEREQEVCLELKASSIEGALPPAEGWSGAGEDTTGRESTGRTRDGEGDEGDTGREALGGEDALAGEALGAKELKQESMGLEEDEDTWEESIELQKEHRDPKEGHEDLQEEYEDLQEEHGDPQEVHGDLQRELGDAQEEHMGLQEEHGGLQMEHGKLQEEHEDLQEEHEDTQEEHRDPQEEYGDTQEEHRDLQEEHEDTQEEHRDLQKEYGDTQEEHRDLQEEYGDTQEEHRDLQEEYGDTQEEHRDLQEEYGDTQEEHRDLQEEYGDTQEEHRDLQEEYGDTQEEHRDLQEEYEGTQEEHRDLQEEHEDTQEEHRDLQEEHEDTQEEHRDLQEEHEDTQEEHRDLQEEYEDTQEEHRDLQKEYEDTQEEHRDLQEDRDLQKEHGDLQEEYRVLQVEHGVPQDEHGDLQVEHGDPQEEHRDLWEEHRGLQEEHEDIQEEHRDLREEHGDSKEEHEGTQEELGDLQEEYGDTQEEHEGTQEEHGDLQKEDGVWQEEHRDTQKEHGDLQKEDGVWQEEHGDPQEEHGDPQEEHGDPQEEHEDLQEKHGVLQEEHRDTQEEHGEPQEEHGNLQEESGDPQEEPEEPWEQPGLQGSAEDGLEQDTELKPGDEAWGREDNDIHQKHQAQDREGTAEDEEETGVTITSQEPVQVDDNPHVEAAENEEGDGLSPAETEETQEDEDEGDAGCELQSQQQPQSPAGQEAEPAPGHEEVRYGDTGEAPGDPQGLSEALEVQSEKLSSEPIELERGSLNATVLQQDPGNGAESDEPTEENVHSEDAQLEEPRMELEDTLLNSTPLCAYSGEILQSAPNPLASGGDEETAPEMAQEEEGELRGSDEAEVHAVPESCEESGMELSPAPECTEEEEGYFIVSAPNQEGSSMEEAENSEEFEEIKVEAAEDRKDELTVPGVVSPVAEDEGHLEKSVGEAEDVKMPMGEFEMPKEEDEEDEEGFSAELQEGLAVPMAEGHSDKTTLGDEGLGEEDVQDGDSPLATETSNTDPPPGSMLEHEARMEAAEYLPDVSTQLPVDITKDSDILEIVEQALEFNQELVLGAKLAKDGQGDNGAQPPQEEEGGSSAASSSDEQPTVQEAVAEPGCTENGEQNGLHRQASLEDLAEFTEEGLNGITHPGEAPAAHTLPLPSKHGGAEPIPALSPLQDHVLHPEQEPWSSGEE
ncbi:nestin [Cyrtonyx montezumae]|uniref:nestin n=1 Tax=Cyrtonyx montezumae TaxID=9017 RepID=UPI0032DA425C